MGFLSEVVLSEVGGLSSLETLASQAIAYLPLLLYYSHLGRFFILKCPLLCVFNAKRGFFVSRFWLVSIVLVLLVAVFIVVFNPFKPVIVPPVENPDNNTDYLVTEGLLDTGPEFSDLSECQSLSGEDKTDCIMGVAETKKDASICGILSGDDVAWCQKDAIVAKGNETDCDSLQQPQKNQCYYDFGYKNDSIASCQKVALKYMADDCLRFVAQHTVKTDACELVFDSDVKDDCFFTVAVYSDFISLCNRIIDAETRTDCQLAFQPVPDLPLEEP